MKTVICLGHKACDIGELFEKSLQVKLIDIDIEGENCFSLSRQKTPEDYEKNVPRMDAFFNNISDEVLFITSADTDTVSCSLKILEQIKHKNITIVYLRSDRSFLTSHGVLVDRVAFNVLQEYTRSGLFKNMFLIDETQMDAFVSESAVEEYYETYLKFIRDMILNYLSTLGEAVINNNIIPSEVERLATFAIYNLNEDKEISLYNMNLVTIKNYHFFLTEDTLKNDKKIMRSIKEKIRNKTVDNTRVSYTIRSTSGKTDYCFVVYYSKAISQ
jgi:hypothetical protein